jgi:hypothetical protein
VPADHKSYTRLIIASALVDALAGLELAYPTLSRAELREFAAARRESARD